MDLCLRLLSPSCVCRDSKEQQDVLQTQRSFTLSSKKRKKKKKKPRVNPGWSHDGETNIWKAHPAVGTCLELKNGPRPP